MMDFMRKSILTGVGLALQTKKEVEDLAKELMEKSKMTEGEGKKFFDEMISKYEDSKESLEKSIESGVKSFLGKADVATKEEVNELKDEIKSLKEELSKIKK